MHLRISPVSSICFVQIKTMLYPLRCLLLSSAMLLADSGCSAIRLKGFYISRYWNEQLYWANITEDVVLHVNAPSDGQLNPALPTRLILFTLPNGNTINQTV